MNDSEMCRVLVGLLLSAVLASPWVVYVMRKRDERKPPDKRRRRRGKPPGK